MDEEAALIARHVAMAAAAWFNAPHDTTAYQRLSEAVEEWNAYCQPRLGPMPSPALEELFDLLADQPNPPSPLAQGVAGLEETLRSQARRAL